MRAKDQFAGGKAVASCEHLEQRRLFTAALVNQELHRPPRCVADLNGDKCEDVIVVTNERTGGGGSGGAIGFDTYLNDGKGNMQFVSHTTCKAEAGTVADGIAVTNIDGGAPDVALKIVTGRATSADPQAAPVVSLILLSGTGKGDFVQRNTLVIPHVLETRRWSQDPYVEDTQRGCVSGDIDGDQVPDVISWIESDVVALLAKTGKPTPVNVLFNPREYSRVFGVGDMDGDGRADLIAGLDDALCWVPFDLTAEGSPVAGKIQQVQGVGITQKTQIVVGDVDGDGITDDLVLMDAQRVTVGINNLSSGGGIKFAQVDGTLGADPDEVLVGDIDGDGKDEVFVTVDKTKPETATKKYYVGHVTLLKQ
ncbi:MAG TPA: VCBS repeat-containing protein [Tepidisphaeraceae bacterium]|jgi:hypothetical protein